MCPQCHVHTSIQNTQHVASTTLGPPLCCSSPHLLKKHINILWQEHVLAHRHALQVCNSAGSPQALLCELVHQTSSQIATDTRLPEGGCDAGTYFDSAWPVMRETCALVEMALYCRHLALSPAVLQLLVQHTQVHLHSTYGCSGLIFPSSSVSQSTNRNLLPSASLCVWPDAFTVQYC